MILFADEWHAFGDTAGGALRFNGKPERKGTCGHGPHLVDLRATFVAWGVVSASACRSGWSATPTSRRRSRFCCA